LLPSCPSKGKVKEKLFLSISGKSQGIAHQVREMPEILHVSQQKVREFYFWLATRFVKDFLCWQMKCCQKNYTKKFICVVSLLALLSKDLPFQHFCFDGSLPSNFIIYYYYSGTKEMTPNHC